MADKMDIGLFRLMVLSNDFQDISNDFTKFDSKKCTFYYDESNNVRKLWLNTNDFNAPVDSDFVLGGVMHFGDKPSADVDALKRELRLQKSAKEIKFKHISRAKTFLELAFLQDNPEKTILDNYSTFYIRPIGLFPFAKHIFDNEYKIEEVFEKYEFYNGDSKVENYCFANSTSNPYIQISDCVVGLLGKYYTYINSLNLLQAQYLFKTISEKQLNTLRLLAKLVIKSETLSKLLLNSVESIEEREIGGFILQSALLK